MASDSKEIAFDLQAFRIYNDGSIKRFIPIQFIPPSDDPNAAVRSKDVVIDSETGLSVRIFMPGRRCDANQKLPLVVYTHGGAFCIGSATGLTYHNHLTNLVEKAKAIAVSVQYRLAPEHPLPTAFDDSWAAFRWVAAHATSEGPDPWLNEHADFRRVFVGGDSAGGNIANDVAVRAGDSKLPGVEVEGIFLVHPWFGGKEEDKLYKLLCPTSSGRDDDPRLNPAVDPRIGKMAGRRVLFFLAEQDSLRNRGMAYSEGLKKSEWSGEVEIMESLGEGHCFHLFNPNKDTAAALVDRLVAFINGR
ncbi:putative carboxylesterase 13 [Dorcoceras hygrometricum]|uniref:Putative carboxylesterase 13 n=1 Tax=Dorcoceras hygrometricum TaxID=472368 RepID=A0A2Z7D976_9LAMI|nr:putative carboxylesterase 13 [Dorcoceras hygrometricum]